MVFHFLIHLFQRRICTSNIQQEQIVQAVTIVLQLKYLFSLWQLKYTGASAEGERENDFRFFLLMSLLQIKQFDDFFFFFNINYSRSARCTCAKLPCRHLLPVTYTHSAHVSHHFVIAQQTHTLFCGDQTAHKTANCIKPSDLQKMPPSPKKHSFSDDFPAYKCFSCY